MVLIDDVNDVIFPSELGSEYTDAKEKYIPARAPKFVGFQCFGCDGRHESLAELIDCQTRKMQFYVNEAARDNTFVKVSDRALGW